VNESFASRWTEKSLLTRQSGCHTVEVYRTRICEENMYMWKVSISEDSVFMWGVFICEDDVCEECAYDDPSKNEGSL